MSDNRGRAVAWTALYSIAYIGCAAALASSVFPSGYTPWYPPAGLTLAFLIMARPRPVTIAIALAVRLLNTAIVFPEAWRSEPDGVVARAIAITGCYALAAWALCRVRLHHARLRELGWFAVIGVVGAPLCAALSVAVIEVVLLGGNANGAFDSAFTFWVGDAVAIASIVPAVLFVAASRRGFVTSPRLPLSRAARVETLVQAAALILVPVCAIAISKRNGESAYLVLAVVPVIWVALRRSLVIAAIGLLVLTATLSIAAAHSFERDLALIEVQTVLLAAALAVCTSPPPSTPRRWRWPT